MIGGGSYALRGRRPELARFKRLVADLRAGHGQVLLVRGEAGIGKSALLDHLARTADGCVVARASGVESEMELPFAGLHQLCAPMLDLADRLPHPQREALEVAFGVRAGAAPDRFVVGAATLTLLSEVAADRPLLCIVDDAQWLDQASAQALTFAARRLFADRIGVVFAARQPVTRPEWRGLPELVIRGLADHDARALLAAVVPGRIDEHVRDRIVAETRGNPLALLELPRGLSPAELAGGFERPDAQPLASQLEQNFAHRISALPAQSRRLLLTAAAEPVGDIGLLQRALAVLDVPIGAAGPAEEAGLIELGATVRFRHPLVRSAAYREASPADRRAAHQALADATDPDLDPDRRAWHRANGALGPDEVIAGELIASADRALRRGGIAASAAFLHRATDLTPDPTVRADRALAAAQAALGAGAFETALKLLVIADEDPANELRQAQAELLRAQITFVTGHGMEAPRLLLDSARRLEPLDAGLARDTYLDALMAAMLAGRLSGDVDLPVVAQAARAAPVPPIPDKRDVLLETLARFFSDDFPAAVPLGREVIESFSGRNGSDDYADLRWLWLAGLVAINLWDDAGWDVLTARHVRVARDVGDLTQLPLVLGPRLVIDLFAGDFAVAESMVREIEMVREATYAVAARYEAITLAAWRGQADLAGRLIDASLTDARARGEGGGVASHLWARALLMNSLGQYQDALAAAEEATAYPIEYGVSNWAWSELVESAVHTGRPEVAAKAVERLALLAETSATDWGLGVLSRSRALLAVGDVAESHYQEAIDLLSRTRLRMELARAHLLYGEWLRREGRRRDARGQLRTAYEMFSEPGADAFAERSRRELAATGETVNHRAEQPREALTAQEALIAELAASGLTNPEIGAQMFLSRHTVEWHLRKVFTKLGITSRRQLQSALPRSTNGGPVS
ncbi:AAA family ATPase [Kribbella sp. NPDC003557]|uniref:helix-turn-helix transcriptional regulator n=1 Tax=Kribbella sp. NPDC003557 TaxID=3154449 RepID=UPI0033B00FAD